MAILMAASVVSLNVKSQDVQLVTLQHGETMTAYYGHSAFQQAIEAAAKGDLITLSGGSFASATINKVVTIQGAGYVQDVDNNRYCTTMVNDLNIEIPDGESGLVIEGVRFNSAVFVKEDIDNLTFRKCCLGYVSLSNSKNCMIDRCRVGTFAPDNHSVNLMVKNSLIEHIHGNSADAILLFQNCVITNSDTNHETTAQFKNCITATRFEASGCSAYNCLSLGYYGGFKTATQSNVWNVENAEAVFVDGEYDFNNEKSFRLTDNAAAQYTGTDGTQVGIYGGTTPFTDVPGNPQVVSKEIATETDANGKLSVKIRVEAQQ